MNATAILCSGLLTHAAFAAAPSDGSEFINLERLSDRVVLAYWVGLDRRCNLTAIRTEKGLVLIDSEMSPRIMAPIKAKFERALGRSDWVYVINTHAHDSHPGGNSLFQGAQIVGHENLERDLQWIIRKQADPDVKQRALDQGEQYIANLRTNLALGPHLSASQARLVRGEIRFWELYNQDLREGYPVVTPSLTFSDTRTLDLGDLQLELVFFGKGHSLSDTLVYLPQEKLLVTGAILYQRAQFPEIGEETDRQDLQRFLIVLDRFLSDDATIDHVVPSHSPPVLKRDLAPIRDYYQRMLTGVEWAQRQGLTFEQAKAQLPASLFPAFKVRPPGVWSCGFHDRNLRNLWRILKEPAVHPNSLPRPS